MIRFEEVELFIREMAIKFASAEDDWDWVSIERVTFEKIVDFGMTEVSADSLSVLKEIRDLLDAGSEDPEDYLSNPMERMDRCQEQQLLPEQTNKLYSLYKKLFWDLE